eukprot:COSAG01_NODE_12716_length_1695_cov_1.453634_1_plen_429_part_00
MSSSTGPGAPDPAAAATNSTDLVCNHLFAMRADATCGAVDDSLAGLIMLSVSKSILTTLMLAATGYWLVRKGLINKQVTKGVGQYAKKFAIPCLLFHAMARGVNKQVLSHAWIMCVLPLVNISMGILIASLTSRCYNFADGHLNVIRCAVAQSNTTGLPIVLIDAVMSTLVPALVRTGRLSLGVAADPLVYHALYLMVYPIVQWSGGSLMLRMAARDIMASAQAASQSGPSESARVDDILRDPMGQSLMRSSLMPSVYKLRAVLDHDQAAAVRGSIAEDDPMPMMGGSGSSSSGGGNKSSGGRQPTPMDSHNPLPPQAGPLTWDSEDLGVPRRASMAQRAVVASAARMSTMGDASSARQSHRQSRDQGLLPVGASADQGTAPGVVTDADAPREWRSGVQALGRCAPSPPALSMIYLAKFMMPSCAYIG